LITVKLVERILLKDSERYLVIAGVIGGWAVKVRVRGLNHE